MHSNNELALKAKVVRLLSLLYGLEGFPPVGGLVETAKLAIAGEAGLTERELSQLELWAATWSMLDHRLRFLYAKNITHTSVVAALTLLFSPGIKGRPHGYTYRMLAELWEDEYGYSPPIEMVPILHS